ncbi:hypothetical protein AO269_29985 [Pseudomonas putida]|nr:hypothetical protein AO269_29985 [Pseudomonas putida]
MHLPTVVAALMLACAVIASFLASSGPIQWMDNGLMLAEAAHGSFFSTSLGPVSHPFHALVSRVVHALLGMHLLSLLNAILLLPLVLVVHGLAVSVGAARHLALLSATATVLAHAVFWASTKAEPYVLHAVLIIGAYWLCFATPARIGATARLLAIAVLSGLALAIHPLTLVVLLPMYVHLAIQHRLRLLLVLPAIALGFAPALPAVIGDLDSGMSLFEIARRYLAGPDQLAIIPGGRNDTLWRFDDMWHEKNAVVLLGLSLIGPQLIGLLVWPKTRALQVLWAALLLNFLFAVSYGVFDRFTLFLPGIACGGCTPMAGSSCRPTPKRCRFATTSATTWCPTCRTAPQNSSPAPTKPWCPPAPWSSPTRPHWAPCARPRPTARYAAASCKVANRAPTSRPT